MILWWNCPERWLKLGWIGLYLEDLQSFMSITWGGNTPTVFTDFTSTGLSVHLWISFMSFLSSFPWGEASKSPPRAYRIYTFPLETMIWYGGNFLKTVCFPSDPHIATKLAVVSEVIGIPLKKGLPKSAKILRKKREGPAGNQSFWSWHVVTRGMLLYERQKIRCLPEWGAIWWFKHGRVKDGHADAACTESILKKRTDLTQL